MPYLDNKLIKQRIQVLSKKEKSFFPLADFSPISIAKDKI